MADAGTLTVKLTALTADFQNKMNEAIGTVEKINLKMAANMAVKFGRDIKQALDMVAKVSPEAQKALDDLDKTIDGMLMKLGPGVALGVKAFQSLVEVVDKVGEGIAFIARSAGTLAGGGSISDIVDQETAAASGMSMQLVDVLTPAQKKSMASAPDISLDPEAAGKSIQDALDTSLTDQMAKSMQTAIDTAAGRPSAGYSMQWGQGAMGGYSASDALAHSAAAGDLAGPSSGYGAIGGRAAGAGGAVSGTVSNALAAGAQGGPAAAFTSVATDMLMHSKVFAKALEQISGLFQILSDLIGEALSPVIEGITFVVKQVAKGILWFVKALLELIDALPFVDMSSQIRDINKKMADIGNLGNDAKDAGDKIQKAFGDLNVPNGVKVALARYNAINTGGNASASAASMGAAAITAWSSPITINHVTVNAGDLKKLRDEIDKAAKRETYIQTGATSSHTSGPRGDMAIR